jgi:hypothetical protein
VYTDVNGDIARITVAAMYPGPQLQETNFNWVASVVSGAQDSRAQLLSNFIALVQPTIVPLLPVQATLYGYKLSMLYDPPGPPPMPITTVVSTPGTGSGGVMPTQARPLIYWRTGSAGRKYRGRNFFFSPSTNYLNTTTGAPTPALILNLNGIPPTLIPGINVSSGPNSTNWFPCVAHRPKPPSVIWTSDVIVYGNVRTVFATQWKSGGTGRINVPPF